MKTLFRLSPFNLLLWGMAVAANAQPFSSLRAPNHPFTVQDSIEMKTVSDPFTRTPGATAKEAPDGRGFIVVATEGHLASNTIESVLWYFSSKELAAFVDGQNIQPPAPRALFRKIGEPEGYQPNSYGSLITDVQWAHDSRSLMFLVEGAHGTHHPFRLWLYDGKARDLTPEEKGDVLGFTTQRGTTAYLVSQPHQKGRNESKIVSTVVTGHSIFNTLFPDEYPDPPGIEQAWMLRIRSEQRSLTTPSEKDKYFPYTASILFTPSIAPDGDSVVTVIPVENIPESWSAYKSANPAFRFIPSTTSSDRSGRNIYWPWQYALVNLKTGRTRTLIDAPTAFTTSWGGPFAARWSQSGATILLTKTYLPMDRAKHHENDSISPCAIAEYTLKSRQTVCLSPTPPAQQGETLISAKYDETDTVVAEWQILGKKIIRVLNRSTMAWTSSESQPAPGGAITIYIHQDMDVAPTLWVKGDKGDRLLWDLNSRLRNLRLGRASLYRWTDSSGYTWRGGLILPPGPPPKDGYPLVIQTHGFYNEHEFLVDGAFTSGYAAQPLACAGIAVLQMEDRPGRHSRPPQQEAEDEIKGIESAITQLANEHNIDRSNIGVQGFSRTSWYVEKALEESPLLFRAAILVDGVDQSYVSEVLFSPAYTAARDDVERSIGAPPFGPGLSKWIQNAAGFNLHKVEAAVRIEAHGSTFSVLGEWEIYSILEQQQKPVDLINIVHGQHILQRPKERYVSQQGAVDWFRFWLQDYKGCEAETVSQCKMWQEMKSTSIGKNYEASHVQ